MEFKIFDKNEIEEMCNAMIKNMKEEQRQVFIEQYGSREKALEVSMNPGNADIQLEYQKRVETICHKLAENKGKDVYSKEIQELMAEYDSLTKEM